MNLNETLMLSAVDAFAESRHRRKARTVVLPYVPTLFHAHELLCFFKPEVMALPDDKVKAICDVTLQAFHRFNVAITSCVILNGSYLQKYALMERHYGVINLVARDGLAALPDAAKLRFIEVFGSRPEDAPVLGGIQVLHAFPQLDEGSLNASWEKSKATKLAAGTYCSELAIGNESVFVLNGFHPCQLKHFVRPDANLMALTIQTETPWAILRDDMLGATNPAVAKSGSLRKVFLDEKASFGLAEVSQPFNCMHLSAGPIEAIAETLRFVADHARGHSPKLSDTALGRWFQDGELSVDFLSQLLTNPRISFNGQMTTPFDLTEGMNAADCREFLRKHQQEFGKLVPNERRPVSVMRANC